MRHLGAVLVLVCVLLSSSVARADNRDMWWGVVAGGAAFTLGGGMFVWHGKNKVDDARDELCERGAYPNDPSCPSTADPTLTVAEVDRLNAKGDRGETIANLGLGMVALGAAVTAVGVYKVVTIKPAKTENVALTPVVSPRGAGASLTLRW